MNLPAGTEFVVNADRSLRPVDQVTVNHLAAILRKLQRENAKLREALRAAEVR